MTQTALDKNLRHPMLQTDRMESAQIPIEVGRGTGDCRMFATEK